MASPSDSESNKAADLEMNISDLLKCWSVESQKVVEYILLDELELKNSLKISSIGDDGIATLGRVLQQRAFPRIKTLNLVYTYSSQVEEKTATEESGIQEIAKAIGRGRLPFLETLRLKSQIDSYEDDSGFPCDHFTNYNAVSGRGLSDIASALGSGHVSNLRSLHLGSETEVFPFEGAKALAEVLRSEHLPLLEDITLRGVVEEEAVIAVFGALGARTVGAFKSLDFQACTIGVHGARALANALHSPPLSSLLRLDLGYCRSIGDKEVALIVPAFKSPDLKELWCLGLAIGSLGEKGLLQIAGLLEAGHLPGLQYLFLIGSRNTQTSAHALIRAYRENTALTVDISVDWPNAALRNDAEGFKRRNKLKSLSPEAVKASRFSDDLDCTNNEVESDHTESFPHSHSHVHMQVAPSSSVHYGGSRSHSGHNRHSRYSKWNWLTKSNILTKIQKCAASAHGRGDVEKYMRID